VLYTLLPGRPVQSNTNSTSLGTFSIRTQISTTIYSHVCMQLSGLGQCRVKTLLMVWHCSTGFETGFS